MKDCLLITCLVLIMQSCSNKLPPKLFTELSVTETGINFRNLIKEDNPDFNIALYPYFYNGSGVAIGDINNDGLPDICFTGNMVKNRLFLNKGNMHFEDITERSGIASKEGWCTGVTMVDINEDGRMDIYICRSGLKNETYRKNLLYINNGDLSFTEQAATYGLDDPGYSTQASFFDYDKDGDLDMFLINQSDPKYSMGKIEFVQLRGTLGDPSMGNKLFRNDQGHFTNVTKMAGISSNVLSFSLGVSTADINNDGWPDIYVGNDFKEPDYLYINNHNGTFKDSLASMMDHTSLYSMGIDVNDFNNDLLPDLVELDMLPEGNHAQKMHMGADNFDQYNLLFRNGMFYQYMKNSLQKNNGDGTFSEIGQQAGISNTDWSWSPLFADLDNDGLKDLFVTNGYKRDNTDIQFIKYSYDQSLRMQNGGPAVSVEEYISHMPGINVSNYAFKNEGDSFVNKAEAWGLAKNSFSNSAAYADLDNDGDLDLVINNIDAYAGIFKNNSETINKNNYLEVKLTGDLKNRAGIGAKVYAFAGKDNWVQEQLPVRGFQSSVDQVLHFGLGNHTKLDSVLIYWPDGKKQLFIQVKANQVLQANIQQAKALDSFLSLHNLFFEPDSGLLEYKHIENEFNDFTVQGLLPHYYSRSGPCMAKGDVNGDGKEDLFIGGARGQASALFINDGNGFSRRSVPAFEADAGSEDVAAVFFDADNDGDRDLYVGSGGYEFSADDSLLIDRLYLNDGKGNFTKSKSALPFQGFSTSCVKAADIDSDGDQDLFIGGRVIPGRFPLSPGSKILINDGNGIYSDGTNIICSSLKNSGIISDAVWADINGDKKPDLITVGEWTPVTIYINKNGKLLDASNQYIKFAAKGWWNTIHAEDFDEDGDIDLVLGNQGLNNQFKVSEKEPIELYYKDFDQNGSIDPILCYYIGGKSFPAYSRDDITEQLPYLKKKYLYYTNYADETMVDIFSPGEQKGMQKLSAQIMETVYLQNNGATGFSMKKLPAEAQYAPVYAIISGDFNRDGHKDFVLGGNNTFTRIKFSRYDANHGMLFLGNGKGNFTYVPSNQSGLCIRGDVRSVILNENFLFWGVNNNKVVSYRIK
jgi:enediyne biosynthesis protein E4